MEERSSQFLGVGEFSPHIEHFIRTKYLQEDAAARQLIETIFMKNDKLHLISPNVGESEKALMRVFNTVSSEKKKNLIQDFPDYDLVFSNTWNEKDDFVFALRECSFKYIVDYMRKTSESYVTMSTEFRSKVFNNYPIHICSEVNNSDSVVMLSKQMEFLKRFSYPKEDYVIRDGLRNLMRDGKINKDKLCPRSGDCKHKADTLIIDHIENYMTLEQVTLCMKNHGSDRAAGFIFFPDGIDYKTSGTFYENEMYYEVSKKDYAGVKSPVLFYTKNGVLKDSVYSWSEYQKFFKTSTVVHNGMSYRYEIIKRSAGVLFYTLICDGEYTADPRIPQHKVIHREELCRMISYRPEKNLFSKNFSNFKKKETFLPKELVDKTFIFGMSLGQSDFKRKVLVERLRAYYMRVQNASTGAITTIDGGLNSEDLEIAADAIWTTCFFERRKSAEVLAHQKKVIDRYSNFGFNWKSILESMRDFLDELNPLYWFFRSIDTAELDNRHDLYMKKLPRFEVIPKMHYYGGVENVLHIDRDILGMRLNDKFFPSWFRKLTKLGTSEDSVKKFETALNLMSDKMVSGLENCSYFQAVKDIIRQVEGVQFFTEEVVTLHSDHYQRTGDRGKILDRLNEVTDAMIPVADLTIVTKEHFVDDGIVKEPICYPPLPKLNDVLSSLRISVAYLSKDVDPGASTMFDLYDNHYGDMSIEAPIGTSICVGNRKPINPSTARLPIVTSYLTKVNNPPSYKNTVMAMQKRNWNVPYLEGVVPSAELILEAVENMFNCLCRPGWRDGFDVYYNNKFRNFFDMNALFTDHLAPGKATRFNLDMVLPLEFHSKNAFSKHVNMLKAKTKFSLDGKEENEYVVNATINYHNMETNAMSSSVFRNVVRRLQPWLKDNVCMMIEKNPSTVEEFFFSNFERRKTIVVNGRTIPIEIDYSKFDKSQTERCALIEMLVYSYLGLEEDFAMYWFASLKEATTYNYHDLIKTYITWQRRTGTATTALGNTLITMVTVCYALFPNFDPTVEESPFEMAAFLGDDSTILVKPTFVPPQRISDKLNIWFNLSAKFDLKEHIYFCSSFIIYIPGKGCKMIPDPKKRLLALTLPLCTPMEEVFISLQDSCRAYIEDSEYLKILACDAANRYNVSKEDMMFVCQTLRSVVGSYDNFTSLYKNITTCFYG